MYKLNSKKVKTYNRNFFLPGARRKDPWEVFYVIQ